MSDERPVYYARRTPGATSIKDALRIRNSRYMHRHDDDANELSPQYGHHSQHDKSIDVPAHGYVPEVPESPSQQYAQPRFQSPSLGMRSDIDDGEISDGISIESYHNSPKRSRFVVSEFEDSEGDEIKQEEDDDGDGEHGQGALPPRRLQSPLYQSLLSYVSKPHTTAARSVGTQYQHQYEPEYKPGQVVYSLKVTVDASVNDAVAPFNIHIDPRKIRHDRSGHGFHRYSRMLDEVIGDGENDDSGPITVLYNTHHHRATTATASHNDGAHDMAVTIASDADDAVGGVSERVSASRVCVRRGNGVLIIIIAIVLLLLLISFHFPNGNIPLTLPSVDMEFMYM